MSTNLKAVVYPILLALWNLLGQFLGQPGFNTSKSSSLIVTSIMGGLIMVADIIFSHTKVPEAITSLTGQEIEALIDKKLEAYTEDVLNKLEALTPTQSTPADPVLTMTPTTPQPPVPVTGVKQPDGSVVIGNVTYITAKDQ